MNKRSFKNHIDQQLSPLRVSDMDKRRIMINATKEETRMKKMKWLPIMALLSVLLLAGTVLALTLSPTINIYGHYYGPEVKQAMEEGETKEIYSQKEMGQIVVTLYDVVYAQGVVYGSGEIQPKEGENVILMVEDNGGVEGKYKDSSMWPLEDMEKYYTAKEEDPTYAQVARERGAKILQVRALPNSIMAKGEIVTEEIGTENIPMNDGGVHFNFEIPLAQALEGADAILDLYIGSFEVTLEGEYLMDDRLSEDWLVPITFETKTLDAAPTTDPDSVPLEQKEEAPQG